MNAGATYLALDADAGEMQGAGIVAEGSMLGDGMRLPVRTGSVDACYSSNVLEHVPTPPAMLDEMLRVTRPGGVVFCSYTLWWGPWGGHETSPWHLLGGRFARRRYLRKHGHEPKNKFGESMYAATASAGLRWARAQRRAGNAEILAAVPRYHPSVGGVADAGPGGEGGALMEPPARAAQDVTPDPPQRHIKLRITAYVAILTAITFTQAPGRIVADTKFDLSADPWTFLARALNMWDAQGAFGQVQNQAIGYLWPMGPFYGLGQLAQLPDWVIQRLWWALLLNLAFLGVLAVARELQLGRPWAQVAGAAAYVLTPRVMTILGANSAELWPTAIAPWVLLAVIRASGTTTTKDLVRWCAVAALAVACAGGVNATAVSAVIVPGVVFLLTRTGARRFAALALWGVFTILATLWWTIPLVLQGRYIPPFLDYIETAAVTSSTTGLLPTLLGTSDWVAYADPLYYPAGQSLHATPFLVLDAAAVVAIGLAGLAGIGRARRHPETRFLIGCVLAGAVLVGIGYTGALAGWGAEARQDLVDGALAAVRNSHKYDAVLRLGLAAGVVLTVETILFRAELARASGTATKAAQWLRTVFVIAVVAALAGLAVPWVRGQVPPPGSIENVPAFWTDAADYLSENDDGGVTLVVPAARFGDYLWGSTHDEVLQPYADSRWAVRGVVPLAEPGNVVWLDRVTEEIERGTPSADLAPMLAKAGVTRLLVRNDLHWGTTGAPPPSLVHATLAQSPGLTREASFGTEFGNTTYHREKGTRVLVDGGLAGEYPPDRDLRGRRRHLRRHPDPGEDDRDGRPR